MVVLNTELKLNFEDFDYNSVASESFDIHISTQEAQILFEEYDDILSEKLTANFEENIWIFRDIVTNSKCYFYFDKLVSLVQFNKSIIVEEFIVAVKCWVVSLLVENNPDHVHSSLHKIMQSLIMSKGYTQMELNSYINMLNEKTLLDIKKQEILMKNNSSDLTIDKHIVANISFLSYYRLSISEEYINELEAVRNKLTIIKRNRKLPSAKDVIIFKECIESWYKEYSVISMEDKEKFDCFLKFYPVFLWWELTSIIPMRPSEFCFIKRDCLSSEDYYITFPRLKKKRKGDGRKQIFYDRLPVSEDLYSKVQFYLDETANYGNSEYLNNILVFFEMNRKAGYNEFHKDDNKYFNTYYLYELIGKFYKEIIYEKYGFNVKCSGTRYKLLMNAEQLGSSSNGGTIKQMLRPGDLRHVAIISLMLQGYDRVEIVRLAGHLHFDTTYNYSNHLQYWVDTDIQRLSESFMMKNPGNFIDHRAIDFIDNLFDEAYIQGYKEINNDFIKLELGFCKDVTQPCPSFNWDYTGCYFCKHWGIGFEELERNRELIIKEYSDVYNDLQRKIKYLAGFYNIHALDKYGGINPELKSNLKVVSEEIKTSSMSIAKLSYLLGVTYNGEK